MAYRNIPAEIRKEYGEPMSEVIKGYALMGYSMSATAQAMEISIWAFSRWVTRLNLKHYFNRMNYNDACKPFNRKRGWPKGKHRNKPNKWSDAELLAWVAMSKSFHKHREGEGDGRPMGSTILRRFGSWNRAKELAKAA